MYRQPVAFPFLPLDFLHVTPDPKEIARSNVLRPMISQLLGLQSDGENTTGAKREREQKHFRENAASCRPMALFSPSVSAE